MRGLAQLEGDLLTGLNAFISTEEQRIKDLKKFASEVEEAQATVQASSVNKYLNDPINSVLLISRFYHGWKKLHEIVYRDNSVGKRSKFHKQILFVLSCLHTHFL